MKRAPLVLSLPLALVACSGTEAGDVSVAVVRGTVVRRAVAVGVVEPERESHVNTTLGGFVRRVHAALGQRVAAGDPLLEVWPVLGEQDLLRAERSLEAAIEGQEAAQEFVRGDHALAYLTRWLQGGNSLERMARDADRGRRSAEESLRLLREGQVTIDGRTIDFVVRAPIGGHVLQLARVGDPVTPASSYGLGTVVAIVGDLDRPVFRGTVDEVDVGRLRVGAVARVVLGAHPDAELSGEVVEIGLAARRQDNASLFDVRIAVTPDPALPLRAGYSAVAEVELERAVDVPVIPERVVRWDGGRPFVERVDRDGGRQRRDVELGVGDGLLVEVRSGLEPGERVLESARR